MGKNDKDRGLYGKFRIERTDGRSQPGQKHEKCEYFVLDLTHDDHAIPALRAYADSCKYAYPVLADDLEKIAEWMASGRPKGNWPWIER